MRSKKYYEAEIARNSTKNSERRKKVFERDGYSCCITGKKGGKLEVHHIFNFTDYPHLRFLLDNGITMDRDIHAEFHKLYGKKHNNLDQLLEFIKNEKINNNKCRSKRKSETIESNCRISLWN